MNRMELGVMMGLGVLTLVALASGCDPQDTKNDLEKEMVKETANSETVVRDLRRAVAKEQASHGDEMAELSRKAFVADTDREIERISGQLDSMRDRLSLRKGAAAGIQTAQLAALEQRRDGVQKDLDASQQKTGPALQEARRQIDSAVYDLQESCTELATRTAKN